MATIVVFAAMPGPVTTWPMARPVKSNTLVTMALFWVRSPVKDETVAALMANV